MTDATDPGPAAVPPTAPADLPPAPEPPPLPVPPPLAPPPPAPALEAFQFHGEWREYFRIWIVNTFLTLVTLGVFAAWAKVRKRRYLRGNTELMGHRFDYRADPRRLLLGNVIVATLFVSYSFVGQVYWQVAAAAVVVGLVLLPWIIVRSLAFNAHNTTYRGMRFYFRQTYGLAAMTYLGEALFLPLTLGLFYPAWMKHRREFVINHHRLGDAYFRFQGGLAPFYSAYTVAGVCLFTAILGGALLMVALMHGQGRQVPTFTDQLPFFACYGLAFYVGRAYAYASLFNHVWNHTQLDEHRFVATLGPGRWVRLQLENLGLILVTAGLAYPWAVIRSTRHLLGHLHFSPRGPIERIEQLGRNEGSALGDTAGEFIGVDLGL